MKYYRSPHMALLWSLAIPGFGQLYNRDYLVGVLLVILEFLINTRSNLNLAIYYSFRAQFWLVAQSVNLQWLLFYPCVYAFASWHAYNQARQINYTESNSSDKRQTFYNGIFIGAAFGGTLGVIYSYYIGPVLGGLIGMGLGGASGFIIEQFWRWVGKDG